MNKLTKDHIKKSNLLIPDIIKVTDNIWSLFIYFLVQSLLLKLLIGKGNEVVKNKPTHIT